MIEIDVEKELKNLELERQNTINVFNANMHRINGAEGWLKSLDERNKAEIKEKTEKEDKPQKRLKD